MSAKPIAIWLLAFGPALLSPSASRAKVASRVDDHRLESDVLCALVAAPALDTAQVSVRVRDGVVTLTGHTRSVEDLVRQIVVARQVPGVREVVDLVQPDWLRLETSQDLAQAVRNHLREDPTTAWVADDIQVAVHQGVVSLTGKVRTPLEREEAERLARRTLGVFSVDDNLSVDHHYAAWYEIPAGLEELGEPFL